MNNIAKIFTVTDLKQHIEVWRLIHVHEIMLSIKSIFKDIEYDVVDDPTDINEVTSYLDLNDTDYQSDITDSQVSSLHTLSNSSFLKRSYSVLENDDFCFFYDFLLFFLFILLFLYSRLFNCWKKISDSLNYYYLFFEINSQSILKRK